MTTGHAIAERRENIGGEDLPGRLLRSTLATGKRRKTLLTVHIASAVALVGSTAGFLVIAVRAATRGDQAEAHALYEAVGQLPLFLGIPLSFIALISGIAVGLTSRWGVFRHWWVSGKLALLVGVILLGALLNTSTLDTMVDTTSPRGDGDDAAEWILVGTLVLQIAMVLAATALAVFKPGRRIRREGRGRTDGHH